MGRWSVAFQVSLTQSLDSICLLSDFMDVSCKKGVSTTKNSLGAFQASLTQRLDSICLLSDFMDVNCGKVVSTTKNGLGAFQVSLTQSHSYRYDIELFMYFNKIHSKCYNAFARTIRFYSDFTAP